MKTVRWADGVDGGVAERTRPRRRALATPEITLYQLGEQGIANWEQVLSATRDSVCARLVRHVAPSLLGARSDSFSCARQPASRPYWESGRRGSVRVLSVTRDADLVCVYECADRAGEAGLSARRVSDECVSLLRVRFPNSHVAAGAYLPFCPLRGLPTLPSGLRVEELLEGEG